MNRVGVFERVSFDQFRQAAEKFQIRMSIEELVAAYRSIQLPKRATSGSAGYDFFSPFPIRLDPGASVVIPTGVRCLISEGWWLGCFPRSGLGSKFRLQLDNTVGVIDSDYYYAENEGHIFAKLTNDSKEGKTLDLSVGDRFMQGIFLPYGITLNDNAVSARRGGMGSTGA